MKRSPDPILPRPESKDAAHDAMLKLLKGPGLPAWKVDRSGCLQRKLIRLDPATGTLLGYQPTEKRGLKRFIQLADLYELSPGPYAGRLKQMPRKHGRSGVYIASRTDQHMSIVCDTPEDARDLIAVIRHRMIEAREADTLKSRVDRLWVAADVDGSGSLNKVETTKFLSSIGVNSSLVAHSFTEESTELDYIGFLKLWCHTFTLPDHVLKSIYCGPKTNKSKFKTVPGDNVMKHQLVLPSADVKEFWEKVQGLLF